MPEFQSLESPDFANGVNRASNDVLTCVVAPVLLAAH